jgi:hypothetical protein
VEDAAGEAVSCFEVVIVFCAEMVTAGLCRGSTVMMMTLRMIRTSSGSKACTIG